MTTFGYTVSQRASLIGGATFKDLLAIGAEADGAAVIDTVWVGDSLTVKPRPDSIVALSALAATTERVRLGVACMATFPVRDPLLFALQWSSLDQLAAGRTVLAVCNGTQKAGGRSAEEGRFFGGVSDRERPARLEENIRLVREVWTGETVDFTGTFRSYEGVRVTPTTQQPVPILIAGMPAFGTPSGDRFFDRVARLADGYMITTRSADQVRAARRELDAALERQGLEHRHIPITAYTGFAVGSDRTDAASGALEFLSRYYGPGAFTEASVEYAGAVGSLTRVADDLSELAASGVDHISLRSLSSDARGQFDALVDRVLPEVVAA